MPPCRHAQWACVFIALWCRPKSVVLGSDGKSTFSYWQIPFHSNYTIFLYHYSEWGFLFLCMYLHQYFICTIMGMKWYSLWFGPVPVGPCSLSRKLSIQIPCPLKKKKWLHYWIINVLYILWIQISYQINDLEIFLFGSFILPPVIYYSNLVCTAMKI